MAHLAPRPEAELGFLSHVIENIRAAMGFVPNSLLTMAHQPQLPFAFSMLATAVFGGDLRTLVAAFGDRIPAPADEEGRVSPSLVQLIALATSLAAGCRYCQAHTAHGAHARGVPEHQLADILDFEASDAFSPRERAALALAFAAARVPNEASATHFDRLRAHFSEGQMAQIVAVIALFGFLNRWNDTLATHLEAQPAELARDQLGKVGWTAGKHG